jgi:hypothetical protein
MSLRKSSELTFQRRPKRRTARSGEKKRDPASMAVMDKIVSAMKNTTEAEQRITYNKGHIALGSTGNNYCWFHPRKTPGYCHVEFKLSPDTRDAALATMQSKGIDASVKSAALISFSITNKAIDEHLGGRTKAGGRVKQVNRPCRAALEQSIKRAPGFLAADITMTQRCETKIGLEYNISA